MCTYFFRKTASGIALKVFSCLSYILFSKTSGKCLHRISLHKISLLRSNLRSSIQILVLKVSKGAVQQPGAPPPRSCLYQIWSGCPIKRWRRRILSLLLNSIWFSWMAIASSGKKLHFLFEMDNTQPQCCHKSVDGIVKNQRLEKNFY